MTKKNLHREGGSLLWKFNINDEMKFAGIFFSKPMLHPHTVIRKNKKFVECLVHILSDFKLPC